METHNSVRSTGVVQKTNDYGIFKKLLGQREIIPSYLKRLVAEVKEVGRILVPVMLNEYYEVIDGQHRIEAAKILGLEVPYIVDPGLTIEHARYMNQVGEIWPGLTHCKSFAATGVKAYIDFLEFAADYPHFRFTSILMLLNNSLSYKTKLRKGENRSNPSFEKGTWKPKNIDKAHDWALKISSIKPYFKEGYSNRYFVQAMIRMFRKEEFDYKHFLGRLKANPRYMEKCTNVIKYMELINELYNYRKRGGKTDLMAGER